jgi:hypothetical protein
MSSVPSSVRLDLASPDVYGLVKEWVEMGEL